MIALLVITIMGIVIVLQITYIAWLRGKISLLWEEIGQITLSDKDH